MACVFRSVLFLVLYGILDLLSPLEAWAAPSLSLSTNVTGAPGDVVTSYLMISNVSGLAVEGLDLIVSYDPSVVDFVAGRNGAGLQGGLYAPTLPIINDLGGTVNISGISLVVGVVPPEGSVLFELDFQIHGNASLGGTAQELVYVQLNESTYTSLGPSANASGGTISVVIAAADGDINADGSVNAVDVLLASRFALGLDIPTSQQLARGNVAPLVGGVPSPVDNVIGVDDLLLIQKKALTGIF